MSMEQERLNPQDYGNILHPVLLQDAVRSWLREDTANFDFSGIAVGNVISKAIIRCKSDRGILAGVPFANAIFKEMNCQYHWFMQEGSNLSQQCRIVTISGEANRLLTCERVVLNVLARASGIATLATNFRWLLDSIGWKGELAGTRKTTPGFRMVEKYALLVGRASMHRYDLSSMTMLKDNHVKISGSIKKAVHLARKAGGFTQKIEVECQNVEEAQNAAAAGSDIIMLDNFSAEELRAAARTLKQEFPSVLIEASGGINEDNIVNYASSDIDIISTSLLVQGYKTIDFSMTIDDE